MSDRPINGYMAEASALDVALDVRLGEIRAELDSGSITVRQAADARIGALEEHLDQVRKLRREHFGGDGD
jgi:hypothetical protein